MKKKPTKRWLKAMIKDEHMAHKDYAKYKGYKGVSKDELRHEGFSRRKLFKLLKRKK